MPSFNFKKYKSSLFIYTFSILFLSLFFFHHASASTYYVSTTDGDDTCTGLVQTPYTTGNTACPIKTLTKLNTKTFSPGDNIDFKSGDTFYGTITISQSGTAGNPITFSSYGSGNKPIITGFTTISGWTNEGNGIYSKAVTTESAPQMVTIDNTQYAMGRWPNTGWKTMTGVSGGTQISDTSLTGTPNWSGAEIVVREEHWVIGRHPITNHTGTSLVFTSTSGYSPIVGFGYFIQNSLSTLDTYGEWYYDTATSKFYMYFGGVNPTSKTVKVSTLTNNVYSNGYMTSYITFDGLSFEGSALDALYLYRQPQYFIVQNCEINFSGRNAVYMHYPNYGKVTGTIINNTNDTAVSFSGTGSEYLNPIVSNNTITNTGTIPGAGAMQGALYTAIISQGSNGLIENNSILNTGYLPIRYGGQNTIVRNNYIDNFCYVLDDGGGIYIYDDNYTGKQVLNNIILNAVGAPLGTTSTTFSANGLYVDGYSSHVLLSGNTIGYVNGKGIHMNMSTDVTITNNTIFQTPVFIDLIRWPDSGIISGLTVRNNIFVTTALTPIGQEGAVYSYIVASGISSFYNNDLLQEVSHLGEGLIDSNYIYTNIDKAGYVRSTVPTAYSNSFTNNSWKSSFNYDQNSIFSVGVSDPNYYQFEYNKNTSPKTVTLSQPMIDVAGTKYTSSVTLQPYTSIILMVDPNPETPSDAIAPHIDSFTIPSTSSSLTVPVTLSATDATGVTGYLLNETGTIPSPASGTWSSTPQPSYTFTSAGPKTLYAFAKDAALNVSLSVSDSVNITLPPTTATTYTLTGPTSGNINIASTSFTITPNNTYTGTITITPSGTGSTGLSAITKTFSSSSVAQTFTITPTVSGSITLTPTNNGGLTNPANLTYTSNAIVPGAPTGVTATAGNANATVTFSAPSSNGGSTITGYTVTSSPSGGTDVNTGSTSLSHSITGLTNGTSYTFTVKATNSVGQSSASSASSAVIPQANTFTLTYTANSNGTITGASNQTINSGSSGTAITANPNTGYHFVSWSDSGTTNPRTDTNVTSNKSISASFAIDTVTPPASGGSSYSSSSGGGGGSYTPTCPTGQTLINNTCIPTVVTTLTDKAKSKDIKHDGVINIIDFNIIMANWNKTYLTSISLSKGDITGDGKIDIFDINQLMVYWDVKYTL